MLYFYKKFLRASMLLVVFGIAPKQFLLAIAKECMPLTSTVTCNKAGTEGAKRPYVVQKSERTTKALKSKSAPTETVSEVPQFAPGLPRWPTDNRAFFDNKPLADYIQPTQSGRLVSGLWGCTRNKDKKFHAGVDIKSLHRDRRYVPQDCIFATLPGKVAYINTNPKNSVYGNYVVLEHFEPNLRFYTLYAHLASVEPTLKVGQSVAQSALLGVMGCTGNVPGLYYAHVHFEVGLSVGTEQTFAQWYEMQKSKPRDPNKHGKWHGSNLVSLDPLEFFRAKSNFTHFLKAQPIAFTLFVATNKIPDFMAQNTALGMLPSVKFYGWRIDFTWFGAVVHFEPLLQPQKEKWQVVSFDKRELEKNGNRHTLEFDKDNRPFLGETLERYLFELFGEAF
jgi:murein DD-endopeptidase MepM/ murein hydrolase activator NlpD